MTRLTKNQVSYLERCIVFIDQADPSRGFHVVGDVDGDVRGDVRGGVWGDVNGDVDGNVGGSIGGNISEFERTWFALLEDGTLAILGDHGDCEAADATATDLGYDVLWLVCGNDAAQWADAINSQRSDDGSVTGDVLGGAS